MIRRAASLVVAVIVVALASTALTLGLSAAPASAASAVVLVSTDGVSYEPALTVGLFADAGLMVPGDTATSDLWIKNPISTPATVRVNIGEILSPSTELDDNIQLTAVNTWNGSTITATWSQLAACDVMVLPVTIPGGAVLHIGLSLAMLNAPGLVAQDKNGSLVADIQMRDAAVGSFPASTCDPGATYPVTTQPGTTGPGTTQPAALQPRKILGYTGETFPTQLLLLGSALVGVGWFLVVARRRRNAKEAQS